MYRLDDETAIVETLDFFTPVVDDPYDFGRVAAANAFSDVYAMGAEPLFALNIVAFPARKYGTDDLGRILAGGDSIAAEAGVPVVGGHSIDDPEPKYGMVVTGKVHPDRLLRNVGARPGDVLFLTKPLGSGILTTAIKAGKLDEARAAAVIETMTTLNRPAAEAMNAVGVSACTDVTGFGVLGHLREMLKGGGISIDLEFSAFPLLDGLLETVRSGVCPGGTKRNLAYFGCGVEFADDLDESERLVLADAQTSGGLLIACPAERADDLEAALLGIESATSSRVGRFGTGDGEIRVTR